MMAFLDLISKKSDAKTFEVAYITLASKDDIIESKIEEIPIFTKETFQEKEISCNN